MKKYFTIEELWNISHAIDFEIDDLILSRNNSKDIRTKNFYIKKIECYKMLYNKIEKYITQYNKI